MTEQPTTEQPHIIIYDTTDGKAHIALLARDGNVWMNQKQLSELFQTSVPNINIHISNILRDKELREDSVIKDYLITASDGKAYTVAFYSLDMILAIGFRVRSKRGTQFRIWANTHLKEYLVKGFVMDDERLKHPNGRPDYFDELLERIRDIRASEQRFYQKLRDLFRLSSDYHTRERATQMFFAETQNKLLYAVTGQTAAELIVARANANEPNMALTSWKGSIVRKGDIYTAKNYLHHDEIDALNRLTVIFLESAELRAKARKDLTLHFWRNNVDALLQFQGLPTLSGNGSVSTAQMQATVDAVYERFNTLRKAQAALAADQQDALEAAALTAEYPDNTDDNLPQLMERVATYQPQQSS